MRQTQYTVTAQDVQLHARHILQQHLRLQDHGPKCTIHALWCVLLYAAARLRSLAAACAALCQAPCDQAVRNALEATLPDIHELQRRINRALAGDLPKALRRHRQLLAIDLVLIPYHGQHLVDPCEIYRSQPKHGTSHFHAYATVCVLRKGQRYTLAVTYVLQGDPLPDVLQRLLRQAAKAGVKLRYLLLDRGFYSVDVIRYLQAARYPFLMPAVCRGRKPEHPKGPSGTRTFLTWKRSGWGTYTLTNAQKRKATVSICVKCRNLRGQWRRQGRQKLVYAYWGMKPSSYQWVHTTYRLRFGIESSYRQVHQARIRTCTRDPLLRLLFVGIALVLRNVWVWLHWEVLSHPRRGGRRLDLNQLPFRAMLSWLEHVSALLLGFNDSKYTEHPMTT
jgi:Transposase DDE domain